MPSRKRQVLDCLDKRTLVDISNAFGYKGMSSLRKDEIASFLSGKGSVRLEGLLGHLKMADLKRICWSLGENPGAVSKQVLIKIILDRDTPMSTQI